MKKLSIILVLAVMALFTLSIAAIAAEVEHRVYAEFSSVSELSVEGDGEKLDLKDYFDEGIMLGYEAAFATSNKSLKILAGGNFSINSEVDGVLTDLDVDAFNIYSGVKYQIADNKIKPYVVGRLGLGKAEIDLTSLMSEINGAKIGLYTGVGVGIQPNEKMNAELMYLYNNNDYDLDVSENLEGTYERWALSVGYLF